jgi:hypothetical protein
MQGIMSNPPLRLSEALQARESWPEDLPEDQLRLLEEQLSFRRKMEELARGLVSSEYWELLALVLVEGLEDAKGALEGEATDDRRMRVCQGEAKAYRAAYNLIISLSQSGKERENG